MAAKAAFLLGTDGPEWLDERGLPGRFVAGGAPLDNRAWRRALSHMDFLSTVHPRLSRRGHDGRGAHRKD